MRHVTIALSSLLFAACGVGTYRASGPGSYGEKDLGPGEGNADLGGDTGADLSQGMSDSPDLADESQGPDGGSPPNGQLGCGGAQGCYTVYAHADHVLYRIDLKANQLVTVGPFHAPMVMVGKSMVEDVITDLAVAPDDTIYVISHTTLYTASAMDGHVTVVGSVTTCGTESVALTFTPDGSLYAADYKGAFCKIDPKTAAVTPIGSLTGGLAVSGDLVAVKDGTLYATAYKLTDGTTGPTAMNNLLVKLDPATGAVLATVGSSGFPKLFGAAFALDKVYAFTHDGTGHVVTIDPTTGVGTLYNTFTDPMTNKGISFAGAGVNPMVPPNGPSHL